MRGPLETPNETFFKHQNDSLNQSYYFIQDEHSGSRGNLADASIENTQLHEQSLLSAQGRPVDEISSLRSSLKQKLMQTTFVGKRLNSLN